jgi:suppressor for copper-sensitivity B
MRRRSPRLVLKFLAFVGFSLGILSAAETPWVTGRAYHSQVRLISEFDSISTETKSIRLGLEFKLQKNWHIYWKAPGEVGFPPRLGWNLSPAWNASELLFPAPSRIPGPEGSESFGYKDHIIYGVQISRTSAAGDRNFSAKVHLDYLICEVQCVPESADLELSLETGKEIRSKMGSVLDSAFRLIPKVAPIKADRVNRLSEKTALLDLSDLDSEVEDVFVFSIGSRERLSVSPLEKNQWKISTQTNLRDFEWTAVWKTLEGRSGVFGKSESSQVESLPRATGFFWALLLAFIGGALLNFMPCVLPVVFLKTASLLEVRGHERKSLIFTILGILFSFLCLAFLTLFLKNAGNQVGWGFQFQSPTFVMGMMLLIFLFALNLFDLFHLQFSTISNSKLAQAQTPFLEGAFATLLATPCSAPFLGTALTYALSAPAPSLVLFYLVMGLGLSLPYLLFLISPQLLSWLPRPGRWMRKLKHFLGYSLLFAALWLLYLLHQQMGDLAVFVVLFFCLCIFVVLRELKHPVRWLLVLGLSFASVQMASGLSRKSVETSTSFSETQITERLNRGESLFVVVTADWCLTCKYNERVVMDSEWFKKRLRDEHIDLVVIDWTQRNPAVGEFLKKYGRVGIPFSMLINRDKFVVFPELLSRGLVEDYWRTF